MRSFTFIFSLLLLAGLGPRKAHGQSRLSLGLEIVGEEHVSASPGDVVTVVFRVSNYGDGEAVVEPLFVLPDGWFAVQPSTNMVIEADAQSIGFLSFRPPAGATAGQYRVGVRLGSGSTSLEAGVDVSVQAVERLEVEVSPEFGFVVAGNTHQLHIRVRNAGNTSAVVDLEARTTPRRALGIDSHSLILAPGEESTLTARIATPRSVRGRLSYFAYVSASIRDRPESFVSESAVVRVVPLWGEGPRSRSSVPVTMTFQTAGDELGASGQLGITGKVPFLSGVLDVDLLSGRRNRTPLFGTRDRYRITYVTQNLSLRLLDHFQALSPLTTKGQFGTGVGGEYRGGRLRLRGTAQTTRYMFPRQSIFGTSLGFAWTPTSTTSYNLMYRTGLYEGTVATLRHEQTLGGGRSQLDVECGMDSQGGIASPSCQASASGTVGKVGFHSRVLRTADSYPGSSADALARFIHASRV